MKSKKTILLIFIFLIIFFLCFYYCSPDISKEAKEITNKTIMVSTSQKIWQWSDDNIWSRICGWVMPEFEKRKQYLEEGLEEEKEEVKEEVEEKTPEIIKSLWERIKGIESEM